MRRRRTDAMRESYLPDATIAVLDCGHWFREIRPPDMAKPKQGEMRACGHPEHYPNQYPATYVVKAEESTDDR